jgi:protein TonB
MWWLISRIQSSREEAVDELTLLLTHTRRSYLEALLAFADQPRIYAASPFAQRRHLFTRMLCVSKEAVMSPRRIVLSSAGMLAGVALAGWYVTAAVPLTAAPLSAATRVQLPPRDARPGQPRPPSARESELQNQLAAGSDDAGAWLELARLREQRGAIADAEATLLAMRSALPGRSESYRALAGLQHRTGQFDSAINTLEQAASLSPTDPTGYQILATFFYEKAARDATLVPVEKMSYLRQGITAAHRALAANPEYVDALIYKGLLLRTLAGLEPDTAERRTLLKEADALRARALALRESNPARDGSGSPIAGAPPPPPPPPPPAPVDPGAPLDPTVPLRVGGPIKVPTKIRDVRPIYPPEALAAGIQGVVILEAVIDQGGVVSDVRVLRSIPLLDQAAVDAVRQWQFTPALLNGVPVSVTMTMTVNFTQQ